MNITSGPLHIQEPFEADIHLRLVPGGVRFTARWRGRVLHIGMPAELGMPELMRFLENRRESILEKRPELTFNLGQVIDCREIDFTISAAKYIGADRIEVRRAVQTMRGKTVNYIVELGSVPAANIDQPEVQKAINRCLLPILRRAADLYVIPLAKRCAARVGRSPRRFEIKDSKRNLGSCNSLGIITLSPRMMFLPDDLREFVIYHELAHLSEMNHSQAFHAICDRYVDGNEDELRERLRNFHFQMIF